MRFYSSRTLSWDDGNDCSIGSAAIACLYQFLLSCFDACVCMCLVEFEGGQSRVLVYWSTYLTEGQ
jgi:hypothetical protein